VSIYAQQSYDGKIQRFTGSGSKDKVRVGWEKLTDDIVVASTDYDALFDTVFTLLRSPVGAPLPEVGDEVVMKRVKRVLYSFLKTVLGPPASLVLSQDDLPRTMDGLIALRKLRAKYEPLQKTHFRKELILDVIMFQLNGTTNPEPALLRWVKAIDHLKQAGCDSLDSLLRDILVNSLTPEYSTLISMWDEHEGGATSIDRDEMISSICTHFEHVVLPSTPAARKNAYSAYQHYNDHVRGSGNGKPPRKNGLSQTLGRTRTPRVPMLLTRAYKMPAKSRGNRKLPKSTKTRSATSAGTRGIPPTGRGARNTPTTNLAPANPGLRMTRRGRA
jgi:hypothetical protein